MRKSVAVCIVGQFCTFDRVYENIYRATEELRPQSDFFICLNDAGPELAEIEQRFAPVDVASYSHAGGKESPRSSLWECLMGWPNRWGFRMATGFHALYERITAYEARNGGRYALIVKLRPDAFLYHKFPAWHDNYLGIQLAQKIVCATQLGGCGTDVDHERKCLKDTSTIMTRPAMESYLRNFYRNFLTRSFGHYLNQCPECKLGATLANDRVEKKALCLREHIVRPHDSFRVPETAGFEGYVELA